MSWSIWYVLYFDNVIKKFKYAEYITIPINVVIAAAY